VISLHGVSSDSTPKENSSGSLSSNTDVRVPDRNFGSLTDPLTAKGFVEQLRLIMWDEVRKG
jgi:hypothetical protein